MAGLNVCNCLMVASRWAWVMSCVIGFGASEVWAQATAASASTAAPTPPQRVDAITVNARAAPILEVDSADISGLGLSLLKTPQSITVLSSDLLAGTATQTLSQAIKLDASLADSYNTTGYVESISVRGFLLNQSANFRRNGLAVSNYAPIALENVEQIEVLKGVAGLQSGVSAPGGLMQIITKKPLRETFTSVVLSGDERGSAKIHIDTNTVLQNGIGLRFNLSTEQLHSYVDMANGQRQFASLAVAVPISADTSVSLDWDYQHKSQPSVPGLGLLDTNGDGVGDRLPSPINPRLNLNNQAWSLPFQISSQTAQIALNHRFNSSWSMRWAAHTQVAHINDRVAFPDGCSNAATYVYPGLCANGDVDVYDFRSEGERRSLSSWDARLDGAFNVASIEHRLRVGVSGRNSADRLPPFEAYNYVGSTNIFSPTKLPPDPTLSTRNVNSHERTVESYATMHSVISPAWQTFAGVRLSRFNRESALSDGSEAIQLTQTIATPWAGVSFSPDVSRSFYATWGQGAEFESVPNRPLQYVNAGAVLPALKSRQIEVGAKMQINPRLLLTTAIFDIVKPYAEDRVIVNNGIDKMMRIVGTKSARHRGIELNAVGRVNEALSLQASATALDATFVRAENKDLIGKRITNVPRFAASIFADYKMAFIPGLAFNALAILQDGKTATAEGSVILPRAQQLDLGARYLQRLTRLPAHPLLWRVNVENVTNRIYWREAPTQSWGGIYIFPSAPRTVRLSLSTDW